MSASKLYTNQYRCKKEFLSVYQVITHALGEPTSICVLAGSIVGVSTWERVSIERQYLAIQHASGVFEASSMTYLSLKGPDAENMLNRLTPRNMCQLKPGQTKFAIFTTDMGTVDDDAMILRLSEDEFLLSCGGSKSPQQTLSYLPEVLNEFPHVMIRSPDIISFNIKGPKRRMAMMHLIKNADKARVSSLVVFQFCQVRALNNDVVWIVKTKISMEMWGSVETIGWVWKHMLSHQDIYTPCGWNILHAFRMECEDLLLPVYPLDIHDATSLWEIGCGWMVKEKEGDYIGKDALVHGKDKKIIELKKIQALSPLSQAAPVGAALYKENGDFAGYITSSAFSIQAARAVAFAHLLVDNDGCKKFYLRGIETWIL